MSHCRRILAAFCLAALLLTACSAKKASGSEDVPKASFSGTIANSVMTPQLKKAIDIRSEAAALPSSPGRVALALIICRLDSSKVFEELAKKDSKTLFDILQETALQKSQTLESLDDQYDLKSILASENIFVTINANNISSGTAPASSAADWVTKFQSLINAG